MSLGVGVIQKSFSDGYKSVAERISKNKTTAPLAISFIKQKVCINFPHYYQLFSFRFAVIFLTYCAYLALHACRRPLPTVKKVLMGGDIISNISNITSEGFDPFNQGNSMTIFTSIEILWTVTYGISMFFTAQAAERINTRHFLSFCLMLSGLTVILFGFGKYLNIHALSYYILIMIFNGFFQSIGWPCVMSVMMSWFGKRGRGSLMGAWSTHACVGHIVGQVISSYFVIYDWPCPFIMNGLLSIIIAIVVFLFLPQTPSSVGLEKNTSSGDNKTSLDEKITESGSEEWVPLIPKKKSIKFTQALRVNGVIPFSISLLFGKSVCYTLVFWLPFLISERKIDGIEVTPSIAGYLTILYDVGSTLGGMIAGVISDVTFDCNATICIFFQISSVIMTLLYSIYGSYSIVISCVLLLFCGITTSGSLSLICTEVTAKLAEHAEKDELLNAKSTIAGIIDGTGTIGAMLGPLFVLLLSKYGWDKLMYFLSLASLFGAMAIFHISFEEMKKIASSMF